MGVHLRNFNLSPWRNLMLGTIRAYKLGTALVAGAIAVGAISMPSYAATGTVRFSVASAGFIVGVGGGSGVLHFKGRNYQLSISGIRVGTIGASATDVRGVARNMRTASDIVGTYSAVGAGVAVIGGGGAATLQNANGVILELHAVKVGLEANLNLGGVTISLR
jgi:hypothetical protein